MKQIREKLKQIKHPNIDLDIVQLGMIGEITERDGDMTILLRVPFRRIPIKRAIIRNIKVILNNKDVKVRTCLMNKEQKARFFELAGENWIPYNSQ